MPVPTTLAGTLVAIMVLIGLYFWYTNTPHEKDKEMAVNFLDDLSKEIEKILLDVVNSINITKYSTLEEIELAIFNIANGRIWNFVCEQLDIAVDNGSISPLVSRLVTRSNVEMLINALFVKCGVMTIAGAKWNAALEEEYSEAEKFEKEIAERNRQLETGTVPDVDEANFVPPEYNPEPINGSLNPPNNEDSPIQENDNSVIPLDNDVAVDRLPESSTNVDLDEEGIFQESEEE